MRVDLRPPVFLTAISARAFSKPISSKVSKSEGMLAVMLRCCMKVVDSGVAVMRGSSYGVTAL